MELPSGEVQFVDSELDEVLEELDEGERADMLLRPVCSQSEFIETVQESQFGADCEEIGFESIRIQLTEEECAVLVENEVVEALELNRPLELF